MLWVGSYYLSILCIVVCLYQSHSPVYPAPPPTLSPSPLSSLVVKVGFLHLWLCYSSGMKLKSENSFERQAKLPRDSYGGPDVRKYKEKGAGFVDHLKGKLTWDIYIYIFFFFVPDMLLKELTESKISSELGAGCLRQLGWPWIDGEPVCLAYTVPLGVLCTGGR